MYDKVTYNIPCSFYCRSENNYSKNNNIINDCNDNHCCHITTIRFSFFQPLLRREGISNTRSNAWTRKVIRVSAIEKFINSLNLLTHTDKRAPGISYERKSCFPTNAKERHTNKVQLPIAGGKTGQAACRA